MLRRVPLTICAVLAVVASAAFVLSPLWAHTPRARAAVSGPQTAARVPGDYTPGNLRTPGSVALMAVTVRPGDTLSQIAAARHVPWQALYEVNRHVIGRNPNLIMPGMTLALPVHIHALLAAYARHPYRPPVVHAAVSHGSTSPEPASAHVSGGRSAFETCVIARESGGNPQVMNATGHYGLYQFDIGTWESGGGAAADFGHASVAEQEAVFAAVYAARGTNPWAPYDGC